MDPLNAFGSDGLVTSPMGSPAFLDVGFFGPLVVCDSAATTLRVKPKAACPNTVGPTLPANLADTRTVCCLVRPPLFELHCWDVLGCAKPSFFWLSALPDDCLGRTHHTSQPSWRAVAGGLSRRSFPPLPARRNRLC